MSQDNPATEDKVSQIIADYMRRIDQGEKIDQQKFIAGFPEIKSNLEQYFQNVAMVENLAGPTPAEQSSIKESPATRDTFNQSALIDSVAPKNIKKKAAQSTIRKGKFGRYEIIKPLGEGAMGSVYLAHDSELKREVALKIPKIDDSESEEKLLKRFYEEARSAAILLHHGICPVYDVGNIEGTCYIAMAYISGLPLSDHLALGTFKPLKKIAELICKAALALKAAHQQGVIHRDLKPANIMVNEDHEPIIMDFGLARQLNKQDTSRITVAGTVMGSPAYMSPEQVSGKIDTVGKQSDIYNLGVILYEMLTGQLPFDGPVMVVIGQIIATEPEKPSSIRKEIDPNLEAICLKMMAKKKEDRFQSMQEVAEALSEYTKGTNKNSSSKSIIEFSDELINQLSDENPSIDEEDLLPLPAKYKKRTKKTSSSKGRNSGGNSGIIKTALLALLPFAMVLAVIVFTIRTGDRTVEIVIDDPTAQVSIDGNQVNINGLAGNVTLDVGPHEVTVTRNGVTVSGWDKFAFAVEKQGKNLLEIKLLDKLKTQVENKPQKSMETEVATSRSRSNDYDSIATGKWINAFDVAPPKPDGKKVKYQNGILELDDTILDLPQFTGRNMIVRAQVKILPSYSKHVAFHLRRRYGKNSPDAYSFAMSQSASFNIGRGLGGDYKIVKTSREPLDTIVPDSDGFVEMTFSAINNHLVGYVNGKKVIEFSDNTWSNGIVALAQTKGHGLYKNVQVMLLEDVPTDSDTPMPVDTIKTVLDSDPWIDLTAGVDLEQDVLGGTWLKTGNGLELLKGEEINTVIRLPAKIRSSYELELVYTRHEGHTGNGVSMAIPVGDRFVTPIFSGFGSKYFSGLACGGKLRYNDDEIRALTTAFQTKLGIRHEIHLRVEINEPLVHITATADGKELINWKGNRSLVEKVEKSILFLDLSLEVHDKPRYRETTPDKYLVLDFFGPGKATVNKLRWRPLKKITLAKVNPPPGLIEIDLVDDTESFQKFAEIKPGESTYTDKHFELINRLKTDSAIEKRNTWKEIKSLTWPADRFLRKRIPKDMLAAAGGGNASKAPKEIVALLGDPRLNCWSKIIDLRLIDQEQTIIAAHDDGTVSFHDMKSGRLIEIRKCHTRAIHSIAASFDGKTYATGVDDGTVTLWNRSSGQELITYKNHSSAAFDVQFSPDGQWFASASSDGAICVYSLAMPQRPMHIFHAGGSVHDVEFLRQGDLLASGSGDDTLQIWDVKSGKQIKTLIGHNGETWVLSACDSANRLASIDSEGKAIIWNTTDWTIVKTLKTEGTVYSKLRLSHDGKKLAVRVQNFHKNVTTLWDIESGTREKQSFYPGGWGVASLRFTKNDEVLVSGHFEGRIAIQDLATDDFRFTTVEGVGIPKSVLSGEGTQLAIVHYGEFQHTWDFNKFIFRRVRAIRGGNHTITTSFDGKYFITAGDSFHPFKAEINSGSVIESSSPSHSARIHGMQYFHDHSKIVTVGSDSKIFIWDTQLQKKIMVTCNNMDRLVAVDISPDDKLIAIGDMKGKVQIREAVQGKLIASYDGKIGRTNAVLFSPDGKRLLQGLGNGEISIWDLATNKLIGTLQGHRAAILSIKISQDGKKLASSASDGSVRFWDIKSGKNIRTIQLSPTGHGNVYIAGFTPEGRHLITTCPNGMAYVLRL